VFTNIITRRERKEREFKRERSRSARSFCQSRIYTKESYKIINLPKRNDGLDGSAKVSAKVAIFYVFFVGRMHKKQQLHRVLYLYTWMSDFTITLCYAGLVATVAVVVNEESSPRFSFQEEEFEEEFEEEKNFRIKPKNTPFVNAQIKARKIFVNVHKPPD